jgi:hypothetical protein
LAQRTAAVGLTDRGSLSEFALMADRPLRLADDDGSDLGGPRLASLGEQITSPPTVTRDLQKRRPAQRLPGVPWFGFSSTDT